MLKCMHSGKYQSHPCWSKSSLLFHWSFWLDDRNVMARWLPMAAGEKCRCIVLVKIVFLGPGWFVIVEGGE